MQAKRGEEKLFSLSWNVKVDSKLILFANSFKQKWSEFFFGITVAASLESGCSFLQWKLIIWEWKKYEKNEDR